MAPTVLAWTVSAEASVSLTRAAHGERERPQAQADRGAGSPLLTDRYQERSARQFGDADEPCEPC